MKMVSHFPQGKAENCRYSDRLLELGFDKKRWIRLCETIGAKDNDPPYRDEQRAWYDTLRDFLPSIRGLKPTIRLHSGYPDEFGHSIRRNLAGCSD
jgi:hypothetical protein